MNYAVALYSNLGSIAVRHHDSKNAIEFIV